MARRIILLLVFLILTTKVNVFAQANDVQVGSIPRNPAQMFGLFDYSNPTSVNMKVSIWGYVKYPGKYVVPMNTTIRDVLSFAGGPTQDAFYDDIRLVRTLADSSQQTIKFDYSELMFEPTIAKRVDNQVLQPGDLILIPGQPRMYFKDYFSMTLSVISTLISLTILIYTVAK
jgi:hypothetical protein